VLKENENRRKKKKKGDFASSQNASFWKWFVENSSNQLKISFILEDESLP
jgi:hypothetical protein